MAKFQIELSSNDLLQIIGDYVKKTYSLSNKEALLIAWQGEQPLGVLVTSSPSVEMAKNPFEED